MRENDFATVWFHKWKEEEKIIIKKKGKKARREKTRTYRLLKNKDIKNRWYLYDVVLDINQDDEESLCIKISTLEIHYWPSHRSMNQAFLSLFLTPRLNEAELQTFSSEEEHDVQVK